MSRLVGGKIAGKPKGARNPQESPSVFHQIVKNPSSDNNKHKQTEASKENTHTHTYNENNIKKNKQKEKRQKKTKFAANVA